MFWIALRSQLPAVAAPELAAHPVLADPVAALSWWALRFTPYVARVDDVVLLEASASERLFGGRAALLGQVLDTRAHQLPLAHAQGATALVALGRLWAALPDAAPDDLPLQVLQAARPHASMLVRLGCQNWGQLRSLPRAGLARRFGVALVDALDCAYGARAACYPWVTLPVVFDAPLELSAAVDSAPALLFGARRLLAQLRLWLQARQLGVLALELIWQLDARRSNALHVDAHHDGSAQGRLELRTAEATQDMVHMQRLLAERLARVQLPAPVLYLRLRTLQTQALSGESRSLLPQDIRPGDPLHQTVERLVARLGQDSVARVQPYADYRPECMQRWQSWLADRPSRSGESLLPLAQAVLYPTWLLAQPQALAVQGGCPQYHGALDLLSGPQRLETGWLEGHPALRDYFVARSAQAGLLWIYRERLAAQRGRWFLHGYFA